MSIRSQIDRINTNIAAAYTACSDKGATMPQVQNSANLADTIGSITVEVPIPEPITEKNVNFYDWDGMLLFSYTAAEALALTELPLPSTSVNYRNGDHEWLLFQEWTHTIQEIKEYMLFRPYGHFNIGAIYTTTDGEVHQTYRRGGTQAKKYTESYKTAKTAVAGWEYDGCCSLEKVNIPSGVTTFGTKPFLSCLSLNHINIPRSVLRLNSNNIFSGLCYIKRIIIPNTVTALSYEMFSRCYALKDVVLPPAVTEITHSCFYDCNNLVTIEIHKSITNLGANCFYGCYSLHNIILHSKPSLANTAAFNGIDSDCTFYVPQNNLSWFETETNWAALYSPTKFVAIEDNIEYLEYIGCDVHEYKE